MGKMEENKISKNGVVQSKLNYLKNILRMMNEGTTSLDHILYVGTTSKGREGIVYLKKSSRTEPVVHKNASLKTSE